MPQPSKEEVRAAKFNACQSDVVRYCPHQCLSAAYFRCSALPCAMFAGSMLPYTRLTGLNANLAVAGKDEAARDGSQPSEIDPGIAVPQAEVVVGHAPSAKAEANTGEGEGDVEGNVDEKGGEWSSDVERDGEEEGDEERDLEEEGDEENEERERSLRPAKGLGLHKFEDRDDKRQRKATAKTAKAEARLNKTPKHVKKAKKKASKKV